MLQTLHISKLEICTFFIFKILAGILYGWLHLHYYGGDTWGYFKYGRLIADFLPNAPIDYIRLTFLPKPDTLPPQWIQIADTIGYWNEISGYAMVRFQAFLHLFSFGHYNVHVVFWEFLSIVGMFYLYSVVRFFQPNAPKLLLYLMVLLPSFLFWGSGVHKETVCIFSLGLLLYQLVQVFRGQYQWFRFPLIALGALFVFLVRPYALALFLVAILGLYITYKNPKKAFLKFGLLYALTLALVVLISYLFPQYNFFQKLVNVQHFFLVYDKGNSDIPLQALEPNLWSFIKQSPQALINVCLRPSPWDANNTFSYLACIETLFFIGFFAFCFWRSFQVKSDHLIKIFLYFCLFFGISYLLLIGLTVDNLGAIVRYRMVPFLFLLCGVGYLLGENTSENWVD